MKTGLLLLLLCGCCGIAPIGIDNVVLGQATIPGDPEETQLQSALIATIQVDPSDLPLEESYTSLTLDSLVLDLVPNADSLIEDFGFVETVDVFITSEDLNRVLIASSFPGKQSAKLKLSCEDVDLKPFLEKNATIEIELTGHAPSENVSFEVSADFSVTLGGRINSTYHKIF
jgi:hypothetical protein